MNTNSVITKATLLLISSLTVMAGATIAPSLPTMQEHFKDVENAALWVRLVLTLPSLFIVFGSPIAYVGDRINDAPTLTEADLGLAICAGNNVAILLTERLHQRIG